MINYCRYGKLFYLFGLDGAGVAARASNFKKGWPNELIFRLIAGKDFKNQI
jgi:hypothetical protein